MPALFYILVFTAILILLARGNKNQWYTIGAYMFLFLLFALRYDIGNDYQEYFKESIYLAETFRNYHDLPTVFSSVRESREISFGLFSVLFSFSNNPFVWINALYGFVFLFCAYKSFGRMEGHFWGWLLIILAEFLFFSWDRVRQSVAIMVILYSFRFVERKNWVGFLVTILVATFFHNSAAIALLMLPLRYIKLNRYVCIGMLGVLAVMLWLGMFRGVLADIAPVFDALEGYEGYAYSTQTMETIDSLGFKLRQTLFLLLGGTIILNLPRRHVGCYGSIMALGLLIFSFASGSQTFTRIAWSFMCVMFIALPRAMRFGYGWRKWALIAVVVVFAGLFVRDLITDTNLYGCLPYDSILSPNMADGYFRPKAY